MANILFLVPLALLALCHPTLSNTENDPAQKLSPRPLPASLPSQPRMPSMPVRPVAALPALPAAAPNLMDGLAPALARTGLNVVFTNGMEEVVAPMLLGGTGLRATLQDGASKAIGATNLLAGTGSMLICPNFVVCEMVSFCA